MPLVRLERRFQVEPDVRFVTVYPRAVEAIVTMVEQIRRQAMQ